MRIPRTKKTLALSAVGVAALVAGGVGTAVAATGGTAQQGAEQTVVGTVPAPGGNDGNGAETPDTAGSEQAESDALAGLATVTADQARTAAETASGGTATDVQLGNENGYVIYEVAVDGPSGPLEVKVDAGSGQVLAQESDDEGPEGTEADDSGADEGPEADDNG